MKNNLKLSSFGMDTSSSWFQSGDSPSASVDSCFHPNVSRLHWHFQSLFFLPLVFHFHLNCVCSSFFIIVCVFVLTFSLLFCCSSQQVSGPVPVLWTLDLLVCCWICLSACFSPTVNLGVFVFIKCCLTEVSVCGSYHFVQWFWHNIWQPDFGHVIFVVLVQFSGLKTT